MDGRRDLNRIFESNATPEDRKDLDKAPSMAARWAILNRVAVANGHISKADLERARTPRAARRHRCSTCNRLH